jgi:predicted nucleotidyltransferase/uncharacterized protein (UPF0332 family)
MKMTKKKSVKKKASVKPVQKAEKVVENKTVQPETKSQVLERKLVTEKDIAMDFAEKVHKRFDRVVRASILFGSQAKGEAVTGSDIDIILIVDDAAIDWDLELVAWYREELAKLIENQKYSVELHVNTVKLTTWWEDMIHGDPVVINILRYGEALIDYGGFFNPLKALLLKGRVRSTPEAVNSALQRAPAHIIRSKISAMGAIEGVYWAMVDSAQAALMTAGRVPPSPEHIPELLKDVFVDAGMLKMSYVKGMSELYALHKAITHRQIANLKGTEIDKWQDLAESFLSEMTRIINILLDAREQK